MKKKGTSINTNFKLKSTSLSYKTIQDWKINAWGGKKYAMNKRTIFYKKN